MLPSIAFAQEATLSGTVADTTGGVLPGVTISAVHEATGNTFVAVTDDKGAFRLPVRTGVHRVTVEPRDSPRSRGRSTCWSISRPSSTFSSRRPRCRRPSR